MDGLREHHDQCVDRKGVFDKAIQGIKAAKAKGFRVTTNTTVFEGSQPEEMQEFFDFLGTLGTRWHDDITRLQLRMGTRSRSFSQTRANSCAFSTDSSSLGKQGKNFGILTIILYFLIF